MATIPAVGTRWRCKTTGDVVDVEEVSYSSGVWVVISRLASPADGKPRLVIARAHWFTTEGYEHVEPVSAP